MVRYRRLTATGDFPFGNQQGDFYINQPEAPAQAVQTRLRLWLGQWFTDTSDGMDWLGKILGTGTGGIRDIALQTRVLGTQGITGIDGYSSNSNANTRQFSASFTLNTQFGPYVPARTQFITPNTTPDRQPPEPPIQVVVTSLNDTAVNVTWSIYSP